MKGNCYIPANPYIVLEDLNMDWDKEDVKKFDYLWKEGRSIQEIAKRFKRQQDEIAVIILDRSRKGKISKRKNGILGEVI